MWTLEGLFVMALLFGLQLQTYSPCVRSVEASCHSPSSHAGFFCAGLTQELGCAES